MFCENEFALVCETLRKNRVPVTVVTPEDMIDELTPQTVYTFRDTMHTVYTAFLLPNDQVALIGPYMHRSLSSEQILEISERNGYTPRSQKIVNEYFLSLPILSEDSPLFMLLDCFCSRMWEKPYETVDIRRNPLSTARGNAPQKVLELDDTMLDMKNMERRYQLENEIMDAVMHGSEQKIGHLFSHFSGDFFEKRSADPLRNFKNYCIIMNTLLRKAAEHGGVHPIYLDRLSSKYALHIEHLSSSDDLRDFLHRMLHDYCHLVKKYAAHQYSPLVHKAVSAIKSDLSAKLDLHSLAQKLHVSNVYLSSRFKQETGKTITAYILEKRMAHAMHLLSATNLQIQTIALHCGMVDAQYFSKLFKQHTGLTPTQFRRDNAKKAAFR